MVKRATSGIWCMSKQTLFDFESSHFPLSMALISFSCSLRSLAFCQFVWHKQTFNWCHEQKQCVIVETNSTPSAYRFNDRYREGPPKKNRERAERRIITILKLNWAHDDNTHTHTHSGKCHANRQSFWHWAAMAFGEKKTENMTKQDMKMGETKIENIHSIFLSLWIVPWPELKGNDCLNKITYKGNENLCAVLSHRFTIEMQWILQHKYKWWSIFRSNSNWHRETKDGRTPNEKQMPTQLYLSNVYSMYNYVHRRCARFVVRCVNIEAVRHRGTI